MEVKAQLPEVRFGAFKRKEEMAWQNEGNTERQSG